MSSEEAYGARPRTLESFNSPIEAFDVVAAELLTRAAARGVVDFNVNELRMIDAVNAINEVGTYIDQHPEEVDWHEDFMLISAAYDTEEHRRAFSFGIEAVMQDGVVRILRPQ